MSLFACSKCDCIENTACSNFWTRGKNPPLCSVCDPKIGEWHGLFERRKFAELDDYQLCPDHIERGDRIICPTPSGYDSCEHFKRAGERKRAR